MSVERVSPGVGGLDELQEGGLTAERTLREFSITERGVQVGEPLTNLRGTLTGTPELAEDEE